MVKMLDEIDIGDIPVADFVERAKERGIIVFDLETSGLNVLHDHIEGIALYIPAGAKTPAIKAWYPFVDGTMFMHVQPDETPEEQSARLRFERTGDLTDQQIYEQLRQKPVIKDLRPAMNQREVLEGLRPLFEDCPDLIAVAHNVKFDTSMLIHSSGTDRSFVFNCKLADSMLIDFLGDENDRAYGLKHRVFELFGHKMVTYEEAARLRRQSVLPFAADDSEPLGQYAMSDVTWTWKLYSHALERIQNEDAAGKLEKIFWNIDMKVARIIAEMETSGFLIDWRWLKEVQKDLEAQKEEILARIENRVGTTINPKSPEKISELLFGPKDRGNLGLPTKAVKIGKSGIYSTGSKEISHLRRADPLVGDILDWRSLDTVNTGFAIKLARLAQETEDGRIHSHFNQTGTVIFRLSCVDGATILETNHGPIPVANLDLFDGRNYTIETHRNRHRRILRRIYKGPEEMVEVKLDDGSTLICTGEHRLLTPDGWQPVARLGVGSRVRSARSADQGETPSTHRSELRSDLHRDSTTANGGDAALRDFAPDPRHVASAPRSEVPGAVADAPISQPLARDARQPARSGRVENGAEARDQDALGSSEARRAGRAGLEGCADRAGVWDDGASCQAEHPSLRTPADVYASAQAPALGRRRSLQVGKPRAGLHGCGAAVLRGAARALCADLRGDGEARVPSGRSAIISDKSQLLRAARRDSEGSHLVVAEPTRDGAVVGAACREASAHPGVLLSQEHPSRLRVPRHEAARGGGWRVPHEGRFDATARQAEGDGRSATGLRHAQVLDEDRGARTSDRDREDQGCAVATIVAVVPVGVRDVWDIEVEEDHSYKAHGFVNHNSSDPINFQNQPRDRNLIRKAFIGHYAEDAEMIKRIVDAEQRKIAEEDLMLLFGADYSQIELRVAAHLSGDKNMLEVYGSIGGCKADEGNPCLRYKHWVCDDCDKAKRPSIYIPIAEPGKEIEKKCPTCGGKSVKHQKRCRHVDLHQRTAEDVNVERDPLSKNLNFGNLYRIGPARFCQYADLYDENGEPRIEYAQSVQKGWHGAYPGIHPFHVMTEEFLRKTGWIAYTLTGRRRRLNQSRAESSSAEYPAITQGIQFQVSGTAQDIIKIAMIRIIEDRDKMIANSLGATRRLWQKVRLLIQVHDEIVGEAPAALRNEVKAMVDSRMKGAANLRVPLEAACKFGRTWDDVH